MRLSRLVQPVTAAVAARAGQRYLYAPEDASTGFVELLAVHVHVGQDSAGSAVWILPQQLSWPAEGEDLAPIRKAFWSLEPPADPEGRPHSSGCVTPKKPAAF
ncbi:hypothetical protein AOLI_G00006600 [Acnodon oligacanthus]